MLVKLIEAKEKLCLLSCAVKCSGDACMGWRWANAPTLKTTRSFKPDFISQITGKTVNERTFYKSPSGFGGSIDSDGQAEYWDRYSKFFAMEVAGEKFTNYATNLIPGWTLEEVGFDSEEMVGYAEYSRKEDPNAAGFCGLAGKPQTSEEN